LLAGRRFFLASLVLTAFACGSERMQAFAAPPASVDFQRDVRPILEKRCFECHGAETQESGLRLDVRESLLKGGKSGRPAVLPGQSGKSRLIEVVSGQDKKVSMPPDGARLSAAEIETLRAWIDRGAEWSASKPAIAAPKTAIAAPKTQSDEFWSFRPVRAPKAALAGRGWNSSPIDAFIAAKLQTSGLSASPPADRRTLIRRLSLDMLGLPPSPREMADFLSDRDPLAWERLVDRVLASPHFGERWARHWLDVVRFAETDGFETNIERPNAYHYRDYVIDALNADKPYDRFVFEQIAGDAVGEDAATGFLVGGPCDLVKSPDIVLTRTQRLDELTDMINTTGTAFLGLTLGCAKCHDHKFDPISQRDFYAVEAVFSGVRHGDRRAANSSLVVYGGRFEEPAAVHRLFRGDPMLPREPVGPGAVAWLGRLEIPETSPEQKRRMALARWIARPENPLTARVIVNRVWHYHFGRGLVDTPSDFGHHGAVPSHPELLDWLAGELVQSGWSLKHIHRLILTSSTYRQSAAPRPDALKADATARLLWRFPPRRLEAEAIRDSILTASGVLNERMGGPGFSAFERNTNYVRVYAPKEQFGPAEFRRMVYMLKVRMEQDAVFGAFDCPDAGLVAPKRTQSTTALQALNLLNSRFILDQAELLSARIRREAGPQAGRELDQAFAVVLERLPDDAERSAAGRLVKTFGLPALCRALFNANEFLFLP
jgi:cytochrome c553